MLKKRKGASIPQTQEEQNLANDNRGKITFYLTPEQADKLDDLVHTYNMRHKGKRVNRNDVVRYLIDQCSIESLQEIPKE